MKRFWLWLHRREFAKRREIRRDLLQWAKACEISGEYSGSYFGRFWIRTLSMRLNRRIEQEKANV